MPRSLIQPVILRKRIKRQCQQKTKVHWKKHLSARETEGLLVLFQGDAAPAETGIPSKVSNFLEKKRAVCCWNEPVPQRRVLFRVWRNCTAGLSPCEMKRAHETTVAHSCDPVMRHASAEQPCTAWCDLHGTEVSVHCSGNGSFACCLSARWLGAENVPVLSFCLITG